ncbi:MAG: hypothetical protein ACM3N3_20120 [Betaproteobacteria bacterium]
MSSLETTSKTLRVIGQVLEKNGIDLFELRYNGDEYRLLCGDPEPPHLRLVEMSYFHEEIGALDAAAKNQRKERFTLVNFESLPEILRVAGRRVDEQRGRLVRIGNSDGSISVDAIRLDYRTRDGRLHSEEIALSSACDLALRMYKERSDRSDQRTAK